MIQSWGDEEREGQAEPWKVLGICSRKINRGGGSTRRLQEDFTLRRRARFYGEELVPEKPATQKSEERQDAVFGRLEKKP